MEEKASAILPNAFEVFNKNGRKGAVMCGINHHKSDEATVPWEQREIRSLREEIKGLQREDGAVKPGQKVRHRTVELHEFGIVMSGPKSSDGDEFYRVVWKGKEQRDSEMVPAVLLEVVEEQ